MRLEIEAALTRNVRVIPILVEGARMPREDELPAGLAKLAHRQALELSPSGFGSDIIGLLGVLRQTITEAQEQARREAEEEAARHSQQAGAAARADPPARRRAGRGCHGGGQRRAGRAGPGRADPDGLASTVREQMTRRQAEEKLRQEAEEKARVRNEGDGEGPQRGARGAFGTELKIFINYRHADVPFAAMTLYRELGSRFGRENIFFDGGTLRPGMSFLEETRRHSTGSPGVFIAMIGPQWIEIMTAHHQQGDDDYVARRSGLRCGTGGLSSPYC